MKTHIKNLFTCLGVALREAWACRGVALRSRVLPVLLAGLNLIPAGRVTAQTFTTLHSFKGRSDGTSPWASLIVSGNTLYGTTHDGGSSDNGTVFAVNTDGTGFTNLHSFTATYNNTNSDGAGPEAGLVLSGNTLYGTAEYGGSSGGGTVFAINTDGTGFTNLHSPGGGALVLSGNTLYGAAGTVFAINTDGTGFTNLHILGGHGALVLSGNIFYGTKEYGGSSGNGTVFAVNTDGTGFTNLHSFTAREPDAGTNSDGALPSGGLILSGNTLYGTAWEGGSSGAGTVFAVNTDGTGFTNLHSFAHGRDNQVGWFTNSDGAGPEAGLVLSGNTLYGTAWRGGSSGFGTVFAVSTDGTGFTNLHNFTYGNGGFPYAGLVLSGNTLYGTTTDYWYDESYGTVFSLSFPPAQLTITPSGPNVILSWPTNVAGFDYTGYTLQSTTNLVPAAIWSTVSPGTTVVNGRHTVTNLTSGTQKFYRLSQ